MVKCMIRGTEKHLIPSPAVWTRRPDGKDRPELTVPADDETILRVMLDKTKPMTRRWWARNSPENDS